MTPMAHRPRRTWLGFARRDWIIGIEAAAAILLFAWAATAGAFSIGAGS